MKNLALDSIKKINEMKINPNGMPIPNDAFKSSGLCTIRF